MREHRWQATDRTGAFEAAVYPSVRDGKEEMWYCDSRPGQEFRPDIEGQRMAVEILRLAEENRALRAELSLAPAVPLEPRPLELLLRDAARERADLALSELEDPEPGVFLQTRWFTAAIPSVFAQAGVTVEHRECLGRMFWRLQLRGDHPVTPG